MNYIEGAPISIRSYREIAADNPSIRANREFGNAWADAGSIIWVNELFDVLSLESETERHIFQLGLADRFLREKAYLIRSPRKPLNPTQLIRKQRERLFLGSDDDQIKRIYEAFEVLHRERDLSLKDASPRSLDRANTIWLCASQLFPAYQGSNPFGRRLEGEFPISGDVLIKWAASWENRLWTINQAYAAVSD